MRDFFWRVGRWVIAATLLVLASVVLYRQLGRYAPAVASIDPTLPWFFHTSATAFWTWVAGLLLVGVSGAWWAIWRLRSWRRVEPTEAEEESALDPSWRAIVEELGPAPGTLVYLAFAPGAGRVEALLRAAGLGPDATAPDAESGPLRGFQTEEGLVVWCGGRTATTAAYVCRALRGRAPSGTPLRGVMALVPASALGGTALDELARSYRAAARAVAAESDVRCPLVLIFDGMEAEPGFLEFVRRMPHESRHLGRFGFSIPRAGGRFQDRFGAAYDGLLQWYERKVIGLMADDPDDQEGNAALYALGRRLARLAGPLRDALEVLADPDQDDPLELTGCYFVADGDDPNTWAYAAATVQGQVVGDPGSARRSRLTVEADRARRRQALAVLVAGGLVAGAIWSYTLAGIGTRSAWTWATFAATLAVLAWVVWDWYLRPEPAP